MPKTKTYSALQTCLAIALLLAVGLWHLRWVTQGWHIPGLSGHEFRQTQTIVTAHAMKSEGFRLDYSTPILGKPWSIPFEFPLYQYVTARVSTIFGINEIVAGRGVSLIAFYLALPALVLLLRTAGFSPVAAAMGTGPVLFAPVYLLYSRAVLIESTAFCASAWFLYLLTKYRLQRRPAQFAGMLLFGVTAVLVKSTTWSVFCLPWAVWVLSDLWKARRDGWRAFRVIAEDVVLIGLPLLAVGFGWVWITDQIKEMNPIAGFLTSKNLASFNFGTLAQHWDPQVWKALWTHWMAAVMPWWAFLAALVGLAIAPARSRLVFALGTVAFLVGQFVFINLYAIHDYYFYANGAGACVAVGAVVAGLWDREAAWYRTKAPAVLLLAAVAGGQFAAYQREFYPLQVMWNTGAESSLTEALKLLVKPDEVIVMHSGDWASLIAYRSDRRMLIIPNSQMFLRPEAVRQSVAMLKDERVPIVIFRGESRSHPDWVLERIKDFDLEPVPLCTFGDEFTLYGARRRYSEMRAILEKAHFSDLNLDAMKGAVRLAPPIPVAGTPAAADMTNFSPVPSTGSFPYGIQFHTIEGKKMLFAHSPTALYFPILPGSSTVELGYRMSPAAYDKKGFDGVFIIVEVWDDKGQHVLLHREWVAPDGNRGPRMVKVPLGESNKGQLVFMCLPGPNNDTAFDWALLEYLRIR